MNFINQIIVFWLKYNRSFIRVKVNSNVVNMLINRWTRLWVELTFGTILSYSWHVYTFYNTDHLWVKSLVTSGILADSSVKGSVIPSFDVLWFANLQFIYRQTQLYKRFTWHGRFLHHTNSARPDEIHVTQWFDWQCYPFFLLAVAEPKIQGWRCHGAGR